MVRDRSLFAREGGRENVQMCEEKVLNPPVTMRQVHITPLFGKLKKKKKKKHIGLTPGREFSFCMCYKQLKCKTFGHTYMQGCQLSESTCREKHRA